MGFLSAAACCLPGASGRHATQRVPELQQTGLADNVAGQSARQCSQKGVVAKQQGQLAAQVLAHRFRCGGDFVGLGVPAIDDGEDAPRDAACEGVAMASFVEGLSQGGQTERPKTRRI